jgi:hypothetical protein
MQSGQQKSAGNESIHSQVFEGGTAVDNIEPTRRLYSKCVQLGDTFQRPWSAPFS